jgi:NAD(P)H-hydrate repair Nnr-like enzyme with NAD(P)H-hydrate epimerase domain
VKILTAAEMREVDRLTVERGIPGLILMENAASRVVDVLRETFHPLGEQRVVVVCGKGNNGGDGFAIARQLFTRALCGQLTVWELFDPGQLSGDAKANRQMLAACGCPVVRELPGDANNGVQLAAPLLKQSS